MYHGRRPIHIWYSIRDIRLQNGTWWRVWLSAELVHQIGQIRLERSGHRDRSGIQVRILGNHQGPGHLG